MNSKPHVAVVGATGAVGVEMIKTLERRKFQAATLDAFGFGQVGWQEAQVSLATRSRSRKLTRDSFQGIDIALFSAGGGISKEFAPIAAKAGAWSSDNSSAFRMDDSVPLVIPEINAADIKQHTGIIANPNARPPSRSWRFTRCTRRST